VSLDGISDSAILVAKLWQGSTVVHLHSSGSARVRSALFVKSRKMDATSCASLLPRHERALGGHYLAQLGDRKIRTMLI